MTGFFSAERFAALKYRERNLPSKVFSGLSADVVAKASCSPRTTPSREIVCLSLSEPVSSILPSSSSTYLIGVCDGLRDAEVMGEGKWVLDVAVAWLAASWAYQGLVVIYDLGAAVTVALGAYDAWEWPSMFGPLGEAWSVRQMWG